LNESEGSAGAHSQAEAVGRELDVLVTTPDRREEARRITRQLVSGQGAHLVTQPRWEKGMTTKPSLRGGSQGYADLSIRAIIRAVDGENNTFTQG
jgi:hypothetical protein